MARTISFLVLVAVIVLLSIIFFRVMASFLIPMFLAAILCIMFEPLHRWFLEKFGQRPKLAASMTTASVLLLVLVPAILLMVMAVLESREIVSSLDANSIKEKMEKVRLSLNLQYPYRAEFANVDKELARLTGDIRSGNWGEKLEQLERVRAADAELKSRLDETDTVSPAGTARSVWESAFSRYQEALLACRKPLTALESNTFYPAVDAMQNPAGQDAAAQDGTAQDSAAQESNSPDAGELGPAAKPASSNGSQSPEQDLPANAPTEMDSSKEKPTDGQDDANPTDEDASEPPVETAYEARVRTQREYRTALEQASLAFREFEIAFLGGRFWATARELANPSPEDAENYAVQVQDTATGWLWSLGGATTSFLAKLMIGLGIMIISMYFFLLDGPSLIQRVKFLSPMDDEHEDELFDEFRKVSRAVVVATLLAAVVQGILAGIGYYFAGLDSVFLLTVATTILALVPFVGATAVWIPASLWLYFMDERPVAAIGLAIYGFSVVSTVDNLIKPYVLHGQSNLHPLLALLSVIGGVTALGPIGILIGPMIVVFLQTLLKILQRELSTMESWPSFANGSTGESMNLSADDPSTESPATTPDTQPLAGAASDAGEAKKSTKPKHRGKKK